ncbi:MAG: trypsin-like serine protease [Methylomonas sp.]|nr:trypsin-like serine protease [Methylomonas sp.]
MVTTGPYTDARYRAYPGLGYDGVVQISMSGYYGSGALLYDGRAILTAAHLFEGRSGSASVTFETAAGTRTLTSDKILLHPAADASQSNNDMALIWLSETAPSAADRYQLYRDADEIGQSFTLVGYGKTGTGAIGSNDDDSGTPMRLLAGNRFDADASTLKNYLGLGISWTPLAGSQLLADFDDGSNNHDALGVLVNSRDTGLSLEEGLIAPGDSGGPAFIGKLLAGEASYTASLSRGRNHPDVDSFVNSSFGEVAAWQRISYYQQWIDQSLRANYPNAPSKSEEVKKNLMEGNEGTDYTYFLLQFTGVRADPNLTLSVEFATRDGTAKAGSDYIAASGRLNLYQDENQAVIPVEIMADAVPEPDEVFYLDVFIPAGNSFIQLSAMRTIIDNDWMT